MTDQELVTLSVSRRFSASPERVFDAWLDKDTAAKWLFATETGEITRIEIDPRVGGKFLVRRHESEDIDHEGEYLEIDRPRRLVFTFGVPKFSPLFTTVTIEIVPDGDGCKLTLTHEGVLADYKDRNIGGWTMILGNLGKVVEA